ncbi:MAG: AAA family ATPase [Verrucomicrobiales bacterium]|nr:AAA family ATPase [Verrucomicrobiales bacterium]
MSARPPRPELDAFLPEALREWIADLAQQPLKPAMHSVPAVVLFADVSGFTALTEQLAAQGAQGLETLSEILNEFFRPAIEAIRHRGGDVLTLAGDSVVACWEGETSEAMIKAAAAAFAIQEHSVRAAGRAGVRLKVRIGLGRGRLQAALVGGVGNRWELVVAGAPLAEVASAERHARPGEVVIAPGARTLLPRELSATALEDGFVRLDAPMPEPASPAPVRAIQTEYLERFIARASISRHRHGMSELGTELRRVTAVFINLAGSQGVGDLPPLPVLQALVERLQTTVPRYGGVINKWTVDDKGVSLLVLFGLPPMSHEDDPHRGVVAAGEIMRELPAPMVPLRLAVATGRAFCGMLGTPSRHEFTAIGVVVNRAARLALQAPLGEPWMDATTVEASSSRLTFEELPAVRLKGFPQLVAVHRLSAAASVSAPAPIIIGHTGEDSRLAQLLEEFQGGEHRVVLVEGEPGIGKSTLLRAFVRRVQLAGLQPLTATGETIHQSTPYHAVRSLVARGLGLGPESGLDASRGDGLSESALIERLTEGARAAGANPLWVPLLGELLGRNFSDNRITGQMTGKIRADNSRWYLAELLGRRAASGRLVVIAEDLHWFDSASLAVLGTLAERVRPLLLVASTRPMAGDVPADLDPRAVLPVARHHLRLTPLNQGDCAHLIARRLGVGTVSAAVSDFVYQRTRGNPLHSLELASALAGHGAVHRVADRAALRPGTRLASLPVPDSLEGVITERVDQLDDAVRLTAKIASILGESFDVELVSAIHPIRDAQDQVARHIEHLVQRHLVEPSGPRFRFAHNLIREAIHAHILPAHRRQWHAGIAGCLEQRHAGDLTPVAAVLAHHWTEAGEPAKAVERYDQAAEHSVRTGAYREALLFCERALELGPTISTARGQASVRLGRRQRFRAEALLGLGRLGESAAAFEHAAAVLGQPVATHPPVADLIREVGRHAQSKGASVPLAPAGDARECARELVLVYESLAILNLFANRLVASLAASCEALRQSRCLGPTAEHARGLATMSLALSLVPIRHLADFHADRAIEVARQCGEESTMARVMELIGMWRLGDARWESVEQLFHEAIEAFRQVGDVRRRIECTCLSSTYAHYRGRFQERVRLGRLVSELGQGSGDLQALAWGQLDQLESLINLGDLDAARALLEPIRRQIGSSIVGGDIIMAHGLTAGFHLRAGDLASAVVAADAALPLILAAPATIVYNMEAYAAVAETYLAAWKEAVVQGRDASVFESRAAQACKALRQFSKVFRVARPRAFLCLGRKAEWAGDVAGARSAVSEALKSAVQLRMPFEEARAAARRAEGLGVGDAERAMLADRAAALYRACDVARPESLSKE